MCLKLAQRLGFGPKRAERFEHLNPGAYGTFHLIFDLEVGTLSALTGTARSPQ